MNVLENVTRQDVTLKGFVVIVKQDTTANNVWIYVHRCVATEDATVAIHSNATVLLTGSERHATVPGTVMKKDAIPLVNVTHARMDGEDRFVRNVVQNTAKKTTVNETAVAIHAKMGGMVRDASVVVIAILRTIATKLQEFVQNVHPGGSVNSVISHVREAAMTLAVIDTTVSVMGVWIIGTARRVNVLVTVMKEGVTKLLVGVIHVKQDTTTNTVCQTAL